MQQITELLNKITKQNITCITPNQRLCHHLELAYATMQNKKGISCWESPKIMPLNQWLQVLWNTNCKTKQVSLSEQQELALWSECLSQVDNNHQSQELLEHAKLAKSAWKTLQSWCINIDSIKGSDHLGFEYFNKAASIFLQQCAENNWLSSSQTINQIIIYLNKNNISNNIIKLDEIILLNFDELTPAQELLFSAYAKHAGLNKKNIVHNNDLIELTIADDSHQEIMAMANWAHKKSQTNPLLKIACVVPHLNQNRDLIELAFLNYFQTQPPFPGATEPEKKFNISVGRPLADYPIINSLLTAASIDDEHCSVQYFHPLWQSPYLQQSANEGIIAAHFEQQLCQQPSMALKVADIRAAFNSIKKLDTDSQQNSWAQRWQKYLDDFKNKKDYCSRAFWLKNLYGNIKALAWPGYRTLTSNEYQIMQAFYLVAEQYAAADYVAKPITQHMFLSELKNICKQHVFQAQTKTPVNIHVLGSLEAAGTLYDAIWISDLHAEQWPASAKPHPFLPAELQQQTNMPHASAERELIVSSKLLQRLASSSKQVVMSYALSHQDRPQAISPLIASWQQKTNKKINQLEHSPNTEIKYKNLISKKELEIFTDAKIQPLAQPELLRGGSALCKSQSQCAFKGFSNWHLRCKGLEKNSYGLNPLIKGILLHLSLQKLWENLKDQASLKKLSALQLEEKIIYCINDSIIEKELLQNGRLKILIATEAKRLQKLIKKLCQQELERDPFRVIRCEHKQSIQLGGYKLHLQIDRIDKTIDNKYRLLDYKSGVVHWQDWFGERISDPQLPLYTQQNEYDCSSISYVSLKAGNTKYEGLAANETSDLQIKTLAQRQKNTKQSLPQTWQQCLNQWRQQLENAINSFINGDATVNPITNQTCNHCDLQTLCRINHDS